MNEGKNNAPGCVEPEAVAAHIGDVEQRIVDILVDEKCSVVAAEMILRSVRDRLMSMSVVNTFYGERISKL